MLMDQCQFVIQCWRPYSMDNQMQDGFLSLCLSVSFIHTYKAYHFFNRNKRHIVVHPFIYFMSKRFYIFFMISQWKWNLFHLNFVHHLYLCINVNGELWIVKREKRTHWPHFQTFTLYQNNTSILFIFVKFCCLFSLFYHDYHFSPPPPSLVDYHFIYIVFLYSFSHQQSAQNKRPQKS